MIIYNHLDVSFSPATGGNTFESRQMLFIPSPHFPRVTLDLYRIIKSILNRIWVESTKCMQPSYGLNLCTMLGEMGKFHLGAASDRIEASTIHCLQMSAYPLPIGLYKL